MALEKLLNLTGIDFRILRLRRKQPTASIAQKDQPSTPTAIKPELINVEDHPLRRVKSFETFVQDWNEHASSPARLDLQRQILEGKLAALAEQARIDEMRNHSRVLLESRRELERNSAGRSQIKEARRAWRRHEEDLHVAIRKANDPSFLVPQDSLVSFDDQFAVGKDEDRLIYFAAEKLGDQQARREKLFSTSAQEGEFAYLSNLTGIIYRYHSTLGLKDGSNSGISWAEAKSMAKRIIRQLYPNNNQPA